VRFRFYRLRFHFTAQGSIYFPPGKPGNILRGAFGSIFRKIACVPECQDARTCGIRATCAYARTFEPSSLGGGPSGLSDWPRPFVFRAAHLDGRTIAAGQAFHFDVNLFQLHEPAIAYFVLAFAQLAREGLGPGRARAVLTGVDQVDPAGPVMRRLFDGETLCGAGEAEPSVVSLEAWSERVERVEVRFLTPTELKSGQQLAERPEFGILMARIRDRLSTLGALYGDGPLEMDFASFGERAGRVAMARCELAEVHVERVSSRTGQRHPLDGFVGVAEYQGELGEFVGFLRAASYSGVGRQTTWGKGELGVSAPRVG
jgi:CRISPR-associated endoribonuclease Cas6